MALLTYIVGLDSVALELFSKYKGKVEELTIESAKPDILVTLHAAKTTLERSLPSILSGYKTVDKAKLNSLTVTLCYTGANTNLEYALGYFSAKTALSNIVHQSKNELLRSLAVEFLNARQLVEYEGNEVHYVNALFNFVAHDYGLSEQEDLFAPNYPPELLEDFGQFIAEQLDVAALIQVLPQFLPELPPANISLGKEIEMLDDFFRTLGEGKPEFAQYCYLYSDEDLNDVPTYVRKSNWDVLYASVIAYYLEKAGYVSGAQITIEDKKLLNNGESIVDASNGTFQLLKDEDTTYLSKLLLQNPNMSPRGVWRIIQQISEAPLFELYRLTESNEQMIQLRDYCFYGLLQRPGVSIEVLEELYRKNNAVPLEQEMEIKQRTLAYYVFNHRCQCSAEMLDFLVTKLTREEQVDYLISAIRNNFQAHVDCFLYHDPTLLGWENIFFTAVESGALDVITILHRHDVDLNQKTYFIPGHQGNTPVHIATYLGRIDVLERLCALGISMDEANSCGLPPACIAIINNNPDALIALHRLGANLNRKAYAYGANEYKGCAPVHIATILGHTQVLNTLKDLDINLDQADDSGFTPACIAVIEGKLDVLETLHQLGADLNKRATRGGVLAPAFHIHTGSAPVHIAVTLNKSDVLQKLKNLGYSLDEYNLQGDTPACIAARTNNLSMLQVLHQLGADLNKPNAQGLTPACLAAKYGNCQILKELKKRNIDLNKAGTSGVTPAYVAAEHGRADSIRTLQGLKVDFNIPNNEGQTPVFIAAQKGHIKVLEWLNKYKANLNIPNVQGYTPAYIVIANGLVDALNTLQNFGVNLNQVIEKGDELWQIVAKKRNIEMLCKLIEIGVRPQKEVILSKTLSSQDMEALLFSAIEHDKFLLFQDLVALFTQSTYQISNDLVFYTARYAHSSSIFLTLNQYSPVIDYYDHSSNSPLHIAAQEGNVQAFSALMELGVHLDYVNDEGETAVFIAVKKGLYSIIEQLITRQELYQPMQISESDLLNGLAGYGEEVLIRAQNKINERKAAGYNSDDRILFPRDIAEIMGHNDIVALLDQHKPKNQIPSHVYSPTFFAEQSPHTPVLSPNSPIPRLNSPILICPRSPTLWVNSSIDLNSSVESNEQSEEGRAYSGYKRSAPLRGGESTKKPKIQEPQNPDQEHAYQPS